jgi:hypothetical protein
MAEGDSPSTDAETTEAGKATPELRKPSGRSMFNKPRGKRTKKEVTSRPQVTRTFLYPEEAAHWFVGDLLEVSGFVRPHMRHRSGYSHYRPVLTKPDPWYFAGLVALEACKIIDLFPAEKADALLREVLAQADAASARHEVRVSHLVQGVMGRLGIGAILLKATVPDILIAKVMRLLLGSPRAAVRLIPTRDAHEQVTSALKLGQPVWWKMFVRRFDIRLLGEPFPQPKLRPIAESAEAPGEAPDEAPAAA